MALSNSSTEFGSRLPNLSSCESEPIHLAGTVEQDGSMLVLSEPALQILQASSNTLSLLGVSSKALLGTHLADLFSEADVQRLVPGLSGDGKRCYVNGLQTVFSKAVFDALVHRHQGLLIIELEPSSTPASMSAGPDIYASLTDAMAEMEGALPLLTLCQRVAHRVRHITGFDRVMVYRFLNDDSGSVIAEDKREDLVPYLGLRYPASDIPAQARRFYLINTLRLKADVNAESAYLVPDVNPFTGVNLDMTFCVLRAMSPVHIEYLRNMGVTASMSISIVKDGRLWGLIACHHTEPRFVPHPVRITCEVLARLFSSHIATAEERDDRVLTGALDGLVKRIEAKLRTDCEMFATLTGMSDEISTGIRASGCAFSIGGKTLLSGRTPSREQVEALLLWLGSHQSAQVFAAERLAALYPNGKEFSDVASGLLSIRIAIGGPDFAVWFRPAIVTVVTWGGNPDKPVEMEIGQRISPRRSFEEWKQTVRDSSEEWIGAERKFAAALRSSIAEKLFLQMNQEIVRLNVELSRSNVELESFAYCASHDLLEPVRTIRAYSQLMGLRAGPNLTPESRTLLTAIETAAARMAALIDTLLNYSQLGGVEQHERKPVSLKNVLRLVLTNLDEQLRESGAVVTEGQLPVVFSDENHMMQLVQNLISNAIKYRRPEAPLQIHLSSTLKENSVLLSVRDNGQGFDAKYAEMTFMPFKRLHGREIPGTGVGLATCKRIIELHNGRIWAESAGKNCGATFWFTLPRLGNQDLSGRNAL